VRKGPCRGKNGSGETAIVGEEGIPQKEVEEVGDRHLPRKKDGPTRPGRMLKAREAASAELERLRLMMPRRRSTTRKKGSPHARWMVKSPGPKRAMSSSSLAGLRGGPESEREGDPSGEGGDRTVGLETREVDKEGASSRHDWFVA
jgi:hypothetical protein